MWLNVPFFAGRTAIYAVIWLLLALRAGAWHTPKARHPRLGAFGPVVWIFTVTFFSFDWLMSLEPKWYSDIFGLFFCASAVSPALALALLVAASGHRGETDSLLTAQLQDTGNLLLAVTGTWVFLHFAQYLIIWMGNLPHEIGWFIHRATGGWDIVAAAMLLFFFVLPIAMLMSRRVKRNRRFLLAVAGSVLLGHGLLTYWLVITSFHPDGASLSWQAPIAWIGIGGIWLQLFLGRFAAAASSGAPILRAGAAS